MAERRIEKEASPCWVVEMPQLNISCGDEVSRMLAVLEEGSGKVLAAELMHDGRVNCIETLGQLSFKYGCPERVVCNESAGSLRSVIEEWGALHGIAVMLRVEFEEESNCVLWRPMGDAKPPQSERDWGARRARRERGLHDRSDETWVVPKRAVAG